MDAYDPSTWTYEYVVSHTSECLSRLRNAVSQSIDAIGERNYSKAIIGLYYSLNGLETMHDSHRCGDYTIYLCLLSTCLGNLIAITGVGPDGKNLSDGDRTEGAATFYEAACEIAPEGEVKQNLSSCLRFLRANDKASFRAEADPDFPGATLAHLQLLRSKLYPKESSTSSSGYTSSSSGGCYIATAVYGSYDCPEVWTLRRYRDNTLAKVWLGRAFICTYYAVSPGLVKWFGHTPWFQNFWKGKLDKLVHKLNADGIENTPYQDVDYSKNK